MRCGERYSEAATNSAYVGIASLADMLEAPPSIEALADQTVQFLSRLRTFITAVHHSVQAALEVIHSCDIEEPLDPAASTVGRIERAESVFRKTIEEYKSKRDSAFRDQALVGEHERRVVQAYSDVIEALKLLHDAASDLRWAVMEHDAELDNRLTEGSAEDIIAAIKARRP
jgi:hypothetical protein